MRYFILARVPHRKKQSIITLVKGVFFVLQVLEDTYLHQQMPAQNLTPEVECQGIQHYTLEK